VSVVLNLIRKGREHFIPSAAEAGKNKGEIDTKMVPCVYFNAG